MKLCTKCRVAKPPVCFSKDRSRKDGLQGYCKPCHRESVMAAYRKNPQKTVARAMKWNKEHPEYMAVKTKRDAHWRVTKAREARLTREERKVVGRVKQHYRLKAWVAANPERHAELNRRVAMRYYARKRGAVGNATTEQVRARWEFYGGKCWMCGEPATQTDHVIPLADGGSDWPSNQRPACATCNRAKGARRVLQTA